MHRSLTTLRMAGFVLLLCCAEARAATYYVDPAGSNGNDGLSPQTPWRTLLKVGISTFQPGDTILFRRDGVWNEWLTPPSSGAAGNLIKFDAYGNGRPPEFTGRYATTAAQWTNTSENVWQITLSATQAIPQLRFVQFGTIWGNVQGSQAALGHSRDWYYDSASQNLYVYSSGNPVTTYGSVTPIILSGQSLINLNNVSYVQIQHLQLDWYDGYGVQVQGASDHIWLANLSADSQVPNATVPIGFYVHPTTAAADIHLYNTDAHRNYVGYRFDGTQNAIELKNCRAYANRTYGLMDNTASVTYSYCPTVAPVSMLVVAIAPVCEIRFTGPPEVFTLPCNSSAGAYTALPKYPVAGRRVAEPTEYKLSVNGLKFEAASIAHRMLDPIQKPIPCCDG